MFKYGEGHDGTRPLVRGGNQRKGGRRVKKKVVKKKRNKKKVQASRPSQYSDDESIRAHRSDREARSTTRIRSRFQQAPVKQENGTSPSSSRQIMQSDAQPRNTNNTDPPLNPTAADPEDPIAVNSSIENPLQNNAVGQQVPESILVSSQGPNHSSRQTSRTGWTQHLEYQHTNNPSSQRRKISGQPLRIPDNLLHTSKTKRKRASPIASHAAMNIENSDDVANDTHGINGDLDTLIPDSNVHKYGKKATASAMADIDAVTLNLSSFSSGSILLSETESKTASINRNLRRNYSQPKSNPNVVEGLGEAIFVLPRGVIPGGASNGSTFTLLSRINADVQWVENSCKESNDFHLWDRFIALQVHGPYELVKDEAYQARSATGAFMSLPFDKVDNRWLHFYRLFLASIRKPTFINLRRDAILMTNGVLIHKMRAGDTSVTEAVVTQPRPLKSRTFKKLTKFGLNETDVLLELLMRASTIRSVQINYSGKLTKSLADLFQTNPRLERLHLNSHFPFDRLSGVALGLAKFSKALDSSSGGTARLRSLSLLASCSSRDCREMHKHCLVHLLSIACPKCETLKVVELIKSKRKSSIILLPALAALVRKSATIETIKLTSCEVPNVAEKSFSDGLRGKRSSICQLASAIGSSHTVTEIDLNDSSLSTLACKELCVSLYSAPVLANVVVNNVCVPREGRKSLMKLFADNPHLNKENLLLHSNDAYCRKGNSRNASRGKRRKGSDPIRKASLLAIVAAVGVRERTLVKLDISNMRISKEGATSIASAVRNCFGLKHFNVANNDIGSVGANAIFQSLRRVLTLEELYVDCNGIGDSAAHAMSTFVGESKCLRILSLSENELSNDGGSMIWSGIANNDKIPLTSINFAGNKMDTAWCMSNTFRTSRYLESVNLSNNVLNQSSGRVFADAILPEKWGATRSLTSLDLGGNNLGVEGSSLIARALGQTDRLRLLWLDNNRIGATGGASIARALRGNESITMLDVSNNMLALDVKRFSLDLHAVKELAATVKTNKTLKYLYLKGNQIGISGGKMLKESLRDNRQIQIIDLNDNELPEGLQHDIDTILFTNARYSSAGVKANITLKANGNSLEIEGNDVQDDDDESIFSDDIAAQEGQTDHSDAGAQKMVLTRESGLPKRQTNNFIEAKKARKSNRPSSPQRSRSRPTPREKNMDMLFLPGPETFVEDRLYQKIISPHYQEQVLGEAGKHRDHHKEGPTKMLADFAMSDAVGEGSYSFEREDEFYASLVLKSRTASVSSPTRQNTSSRTSQPTSPRLNVSGSTDVSSIFKDRDGDLDDSFAPPEINAEFKTTTPLPPSSAPEALFRNLRENRTSSTATRTFAPRLLFAGGHAALEEAVKIVSYDNSTGNGDVDVDALRRAMQRMRSELSDPSGE